MLNHEELAALFEVPPDQLEAALIAAGWRYHRDAGGAIWATLSRNSQPHTPDD